MGLRTTISGLARRHPLAVLIHDGHFDEGRGGPADAVEALGFSTASLRSRRVVGAPCSVEPNPWHGLGPTAE